MSESTPNISNIYALLVGIDCYMSNRLPDGSYYKNLGGCVNDINRVEAYLKDIQKVPDNQIIKLTASPSKEDDKSPVEALEKLPTRSNIVDNLRKLAEMATNDAQVYIHYSGHGGRAKTVFAEIKGAGEIDEGLVPTDIGTSAGQYLRDLELAHLLQELANTPHKNLMVTAILDCCHSGGATRGDADIRGMHVEDDKPLLPSHQLVASLEALKSTWQSLTGAGTRGLSAGGIPESDQYVVLAACRQHEYAYEYAFNRTTGEKSGALTYWLLDTLRQPNPGLTYKNLYDRINPRIHSQFPAQTPLLLGAGDRLIFGSGRGATVFAVPVIKVEPAPDTGEWQAVLAVGQANGVTKGAEFAIYPRTATDLTQKADRIAIARVIQRGGSDSICKLEAIEGKELKVEPGDQAVQIAVAPSLVKQVALLPEEADEPTKAVLATLKAAIAQSGKGWVELAETVSPGDNGEGIDFFVEVNSEGAYEIRDSGGALLKNMNPVLKIDDATAPDKVVQRLIHLSKYRAAIVIDNVDPDSPLTGKLSVEWLGTSDTYDSGDPIPTSTQLQKFADPTQPVAKVGDYIFLSIRNDSTEALNVAVLNFEADWAIEQIHPRQPENFITLEPGKAEKLPLKLSLEGSGDQVENTIKVFATKDQANFRWLELPSLDQPITPKSFSVTRSSSNPLDALLSAIGAEQPKTRKLTVAASPSCEWTTKQVPLIIKK
jgi:hypothetical protein